MKITTRLLFVAALFALVLPLMFIGTASAKYMGDGAVPDGAGGWKVPNDGICVVGVHLDGTLDVADGITSKRDCIYLNKGTMNGGTAFDLKALDGLAGCTTTAGDGAKHANATTFCADGSGYGISLKDLDRTTQMCTAKSGTWVTTGKCVAYGWQYRGQNATTGAPLAFGTKGTTQGAGTGYCYTSMNMTTAYSTSTACPSYGAVAAPFNANAAYDWAFASSKCTYSKGISGYVNAALTKVDGTVGTAAGAFKDLSAYTTMGDCLANGGSWANWFGQAASNTTVATTPLTSTIPAWNYPTQAPDADNGCLHCHSTIDQANGPAERQKDSFLKTGHKNMLRKVTAGIPWAGPNAAGGLTVYTTDGTNAINFMTPSDPFAKVTVAGVDQNLYYIYGDWMIAAPTLVYGTNGYGATIGTNNGYTCGSCHTEGYKDATNPGVESIGTPGYAGVQPQASFPGISFGATNPKWDNDGISCGRCHNAAVGPVNAVEIAASTFPTTAPTSGGMGALAAGVGRFNLCFGCHGGGSMAKAWPAQGGAVGGTTQYDPTLVGTGVSHGAAAGRDFNGHVLGNSFLTSPHALYAGVNSNSANGGTKLNSLGKYDLFDPNGVSEYGSTFRGYTCWQSTSSTSPAKTKANGAEIKTKSECETLYGAGAWRNDTGTNGSAASIQGTCTTCHDVHNSLFIAGQEGIRKECDDCHANADFKAAVPAASQIANFNHPAGVNTPFDTALYENSCAVCHMATQAKENGNQNSMPVHIWRINTSASYNTFPSTGQFYGGTCSVHSGAVQNAPYLPVVYATDTTQALCEAATGTWTAVTKDRNAQTAPDGAYTKAVWVDLDFACGQCHGGSFTNLPSVPYFNKATLATYAKDMHMLNPNANFTWTRDATTSFKVNFNAASSTCPDDDTCTYAWDFTNNGSNDASGVTTSNTYADATPVTVKLTVTDTTTGGSDSQTKQVTPISRNAAPVASNTISVVGYTATITNTSTDDGGLAALAVSIDCGNSTTASGTGAGPFTCNYTAPGGTYIVKMIVTDAGNLKSTVNKKVVVPSKFTVSGSVMRLNGTTPVAGASVRLLNASLAVVKMTTTDAAGAYTLTGVAPANYTVQAVKSGLTFSSTPAANVTTGNLTGINITATR